MWLCPATWSTRESWVGSFLLLVRITNQFAEVVPLQIGLYTYSCQWKDPRDHLEGVWGSGIVGYGYVFASNGFPGLMACSKMQTMTRIPIYFKLAELVIIHPRSNKRIPVAQFWEWKERNSKVILGDKFWVLFIELSLYKTGAPKKNGSAST